GGKPIDEFRGSADVHAAPRLALEGRARTLHRAVDVFFGRVRNPRDDVAGRGIADVKHFTATGLDLAAADEIAVDFHVDGFCGNVHASLICWFEHDLFGKPVPTDHARQ